MRAVNKIAKPAIPSRTATTEKKWNRKSGYKNIQLDAVREQQDPPCTLLSQTSTIFLEGYNFKYEQDRKNLKPYSTIRMRAP